MRYMILAAASALSMAAAPAVVQASAPDNAASVASVNDKRSWSPEQQAVYDALPTERQTAFDTWPADRQISYFGWEEPVQIYYWDLEPVQQDSWWYLTDAQRQQLYAMPEGDQRTAAWNSVNAQVAAMENGQTAQSSTAMTTSSTSSANMTFASNEMVQPVPAARTGEYPICQSDADDSCINAWEAGKRGAGVDKPLDYWPGQPASEMGRGG